LRTKRQRIGSMDESDLNSGSNSVDDEMEQTESVEEMELDQDDPQYQTWIQCDICNKWRLVPLSYKVSCVYPPTGADGWCCSARMGNGFAFYIQIQKAEVATIARTRSTWTI